MSSPAAAIAVVTETKVDSDDDVELLDVNPAAAITVAPKTKVDVDSDDDVEVVGVKPAVGVATLLWQLRPLVLALLARKWSSSFKVTIIPATRKDSNVKITTCKPANPNCVGPTNETCSKPMR
ncbi:expressed unknown protein [Seminavis robusta]|uniref:Uncharacterized protein n=1 Tax=Seminavis robusta TaxID=568900 RepID=A0A9N8EPP5_9STRA|nr:expressed unknown protein [Seminavis robusta]|eukprot:Sro1355_g265580.1 n/a (123) ;mRNA; r:22649-23017